MNNSNKRKLFSERLHIERMFYEWCYLTSARPSIANFVGWYESKYLLQKSVHTYCGTNSCCPICNPDDKGERE